MLLWAENGFREYVKTEKNFYGQGLKRINLPKFQKFDIEIFLVKQKIENLSNFRIALIRQLKYASRPGPAKRDSNGQKDSKRNRA